MIRAYAGFIDRSSRLALLASLAVPFVACANGNHADDGFDTDAGDVSDGSASSSRDGSVNDAGGGASGDAGATKGDSGGSNAGPDAGSGDGSVGPASGSWTMMSAPPSGFIGRDKPGGAWSTTTHEAIIVGGQGGNTQLATAAAYDPTKDTWRMLPSLTTARWAHLTVWTGTEVLVWGGQDAASNLLSGGESFDPSSTASTWTAAAAAPIAARSEMVGVWSTTTSELLVWGGSIFNGASVAQNDGAAYDPSKRTWRMLASSPLPPTTSASAVWTGTKMLVFGGGSPDLTGPSARAATYDPKSDTWNLLEVPATVPGRFLNCALAGSTGGSPSVFWGGVTGGWGTASTTFAAGGAIYDSTQGWTPIAAPTSPMISDLGRYEAWCWWNGSTFWVWGGAAAGSPLASGASFDRATSTWSAMPAWPLSPRTSPTTIWTGSGVVTWGGSKAADGAVFHP